MNFSQKQIFKILSIIDKNTAVFIGSKLGKGFLSPYQLLLLKSYGIDPDDFGKISEIDKAFYFGMMASQLGGMKSYKVTKKNYEDYFKEYINIEDNIIQREALDYIKKRAFNDLSGLGNKVKNKLTNSILISSVQDKNILATKIKKESIKAVEKNKTTQQLASDLRDITEDWARDFSRIADFILQESYGFGRAQQILEEYGDDVEVYKQTFPGVCKHCEVNYGSPGQKPVIYKLQDLLDNGNNIGRKNQLPVVGNAHPWARSILHAIPPNSVWSDSKKRFVLTRNKKGVKRTSKVKIKIT